MPPKQAIPLSGNPDAEQHATFGQRRWLGAMMHHMLRGQLFTVSSMEMAARQMKTSRRLTHRAIQALNHPASLDTVKPTALLITMFQDYFSKKLMQNTKRGITQNKAKFYLSS